MELKKETGIIENLEFKTVKGEREMYIFECNGNRYSGFGHPPCKEGEEVTFKYEVNGIYRNVKYFYQPEQSTLESTNHCDHQEPEKPEPEKSEPEPIDTRTDPKVKTQLEIKTEKPDAVILLAAVQYIIAHSQTNLGLLNEPEIFRTYERFKTKLSGKQETTGA